MRKHIGTISTLIGILIVIYLLVTKQYISTVLYKYKIYAVVIPSYIFAFFFISIGYIIHRNLKSLFLYKYRHIIGTPIIFLSFLLPYVYIKQKFLLSNDLTVGYLIMGCITLIIGIFYGIKEYKLHRLKPNSIMNEYAYLISNKKDVWDKKGLLTLSKSNKLIFSESSDSDFEIDLKDIDKTIVNFEDILFPSSIKITTHKGVEYGFDTVAPLVWKTAILNQQKLIYSEK